MRKSWLIFVIVDVLSAVIMGLGMTNVISDIILVLLSVLLVLKPASLLPVMFVASWSSSFGIFGFSAFYYYFLLFILSLCANPNNVKWNIRSNKLTILFLCLFIIWMIVSSIYSTSGEILVPIKICLYIVFTLISSVCSISDLEVSYKSLMVISLVFAVYFLLRGIFAPVEMYDPDRMTTEYTLIKGVGKNVIAQAIVIMLIYSFSYALNQKRYDYLILSFLFFISLFYLGSRTSTYSSVAFVILYFLFFLQSKRSTKLLLAGVILTCGVLILFVGSSFENFLRLSFSSFAEDQGSGRFINWGLYFLNIIPNYLWTGIGPSISNYEALGYRFDADNLYIDLLCELGIPGLVLFFCVYFLLIYKATKISNRYYRGVFIILMLTFLSLGMGETVFDASLFWFISGMMMLEYNNHKKNKVLVLIK